MSDTTHQPDDLADDYTEIEAIEYTAEDAAADEADAGQTETEDDPVQDDEEDTDIDLSEALPDADRELEDHEINIDTMSGDVRDVMLQHFRNTRKPWAQMSAAEQNDVANAFDLASRQLVKAAVRKLTGWEFPRAAVSLGEVKIKGAAIEAKIIASNTSHEREVLGDNVGAQVLMLMVDSERFMAERAPVKIDPDQKAMDLESPEPEAEPEGNPEPEPEDMTDEDRFAYACDNVTAWLNKNPTVQLTRTQMKKTFGYAAKDAGAILDELIRREVIDVDGRKTVA